MLGRKWIDDYYFHDDDVAIIVIQMSYIMHMMTTQSTVILMEVSHESARINFLTNEAFAVVIHTT